MPIANKMTIKKLTLTAIILLVVAFALLAISAWYHTQPPASAEQKIADIIPPTPEQVAQVYASKGFQYLVIYTDQGFSPTTLTVHKGETVRFANNSSHDMWIANAAHPDATACDESTFNSCEPVKTGFFWEYTFAKTGTIHSMVLNTADEGAVTVQ